MEITPLLGLFFEHLIIGPEGRRNESVPEVKKKKRIESIAFDTIYAVTNGTVKTSKHLLLGLAMKTLTSCKKALNILNRYGSSINYTCAEELETELAYGASSSDRLLPVGLLDHCYLHTGLAFDNYDRFVETVNGRDTFHDTVGMYIQLQRQT